MLVTAGLDLCNCLLDHDLRGDLYESVVVGFLAALDLKPNRGTLREVYHYTLSLSGFIKIAQVLVIQQAVHIVDTEYLVKPADILNKMHARFMLIDTCAPLSWATRLRIYCKEVRDTTACLDYMSCSDDSVSVSRKDV